jgi:hypothetical protein
MNQRRTVCLSTERILPSDVTVYFVSHAFIGTCFLHFLRCDILGGGGSYHDLYSDTRVRAPACVCLVRCIVAILINLDINNLVQSRKRRWRRNRTVQVKNCLPDCTVT